jgi:hypothetical protein
MTSIPADRWSKVFEGHSPKKKSKRRSLEAHALSLPQYRQKRIAKRTKALRKQIGHNIDWGDD